jgi:hypothetical protein
MARVVFWNGTDAPREMRALPAGRYLVEALGDVRAQTPDEEAGLEEAMARIRRPTPRGQRGWPHAHLSHALRGHATATGCDGRAA